MKAKTEGQAALIAWMAAGPARERNQSALARLVGVGQPTAREWVKGISRPRPVYREILKEVCGIEPSLWELKRERDARERALKRIQRAAPWRRVVRVASGGLRRRARAS